MTQRIKKKRLKIKKRKRALRRERKEARITGMLAQMNRRTPPWVR